jgi:hypothetical protein
VRWEPLVPLVWTTTKISRHSLATGLLRSAQSEGIAKRGLLEKCQTINAPCSDIRETSNVIFIRNGPSTAILYEARHFNYLRMHRYHLKLKELMVSEVKKR